MAKRDIIVIGASAGGVQMLMQLCRGLPPDLEAALFAAIHTSAGGPGALSAVLDRAGPLPARYPIDGEKIHRGRVYVAPPDYHLLVGRNRIHLTRGPKENGFRPAVDPLFRTAARAHGKRVIGVILSGSLNDGTDGLAHVKNCGGIAIAQEPTDATFPDMPASAVANVKCDYVLPIGEIPAMLAELSGQIIPGPQKMPAPKSADELPFDPAMAGTNELAARHMAGAPTSFTCPQCGGALRETTKGGLTKYICHVGHSFTYEGLATGQREQLEITLWSAIRALEEMAELRRRLAKRSRKYQMDDMAERYLSQADEAEHRATALRALLLTYKPQPTAIPKRMNKPRSKARR
ncbi:MAG TPA: chemotaxis protein CheB [Tepidisphaeraceae bacterium]|nr:chemotaxis protein CheB [Tepidisphaeraceae bacterium]